MFFFKENYIFQDFSVVFDGVFCQLVNSIVSLKTVLCAYLKTNRDRAVL